MALPEPLDTDLTVGDPLPSSLNEERSAINSLIGEVGNRIPLPPGAQVGDLLRWDGAAWLTTETRFFEGEGRPDGVFAAPVGSRYIDKTGAQGAVEWVKRFGGDSVDGWLCLAGDTGARDVTGQIVKRTTGLANVARLQRSGQIVQLYLDLTMPTGSSQLASPYTVYTLPVGFRPLYSMYGGMQDNNEAAASSTLVASDGSVNLYNPVAGKRDRFVGTWITKDAWPAALPGVA
jgi:hypothetical protein